MTASYSFLDDSRVALLLNTYSSLLNTKQIDNEQALSEVLSCDFEKVFHALVEIQSVDANQVLENFFSDCSISIPPILVNNCSYKLSHVGFEICEPLDIVMENLPLWIEKLSSIFSKTVTLKKELRFSASVAFQKRVNATVEILCLWLQIDEQLLMLELFDIAHPITHLLPSGQTLLNPFDANKNEPHQALAMRYFFQNDSIWHYSISVGNKEVVQQLHEEFTILTTQQPHYKLAYPTPIQNHYDGSFHTKLIDVTQHLELEFVTHQTD